MGSDRYAALTGSRYRLWFAVLALAAGLAYGWHLNAQGWANIYYSGIAQAGARSVRAAFFGALDANAVVATDKPPLAFWPMSASVGIFGLHPWAVLLPQVLESAASVFVLSLTVRRVAGALAGATAGIVLAITPVFFLLARYNQPDTLETLWVVVAAYLAVRWFDDPGRWWLALIGACFGAAFLTKWVAGLVAAPAFALAMWPQLRRRGGRDWLWGLGGLLVSGGWWIGTLAILGPDRRPHADASGGSLFKLILGSNGVSRLPGNGGGDISGQPGPFRLLTVPFADQIGWFIPAAAIGLGWLMLRGRLEGRARFGVILFGGWFVLAAGLFTFMGGAMHPYYTTYLAPAVAAVVGIAVGCALAASRSVILLGLGAITAGYAVPAALASGLPPLVAWLIVAGMVLAGAAWLLGAHHAALAVLAFACAIGPVATDIVTVRTEVNGPNPHAGRSTDPVTTPLAPELLAFLRAHDSGDWAAAAPQASPAADLQLALDRPVLALGGFTGSEAAPSVAQLEEWVRDGRLRYVALIGVYTRSPRTTPPPAQGKPLANLVDWARATGCPTATGPVYVIDLRDTSCH